MTTPSDPTGKHDLLSSLTEIVSSYLRQNTLPPNYPMVADYAARRAALATPSSPCRCRANA